MKKKLVLLCAAMMLLGGCSQPEAGGSPAEASQSTQESKETEKSEAESTGTDGAEAGSAEEKETTAETKELAAGSQVVLDGVTYTVDAPFDFNTDEMLPRDFGDYFSADYTSKTETYKIAEGTQWENEVVHITGEKEGSVIYVIAGVHGDEEAAWRAGELMEKIGIQAGELYILAPANRWGASAETKTRYVYEDQDLNRSFPGNPEGTEAEQVADILFQDVKRVSPDFVLDLHEARVVSEGRDFLGSTLIFTELGDKMDLLLDMIMESQAGNLCSEPYDYLGPGPAGSVNSSISKDLSIPTITVETFRGYPMERRISDQLAISQHVLRDYGLIE